MKILVATSGRGGLDDTVSPVFGRAPTFTIVEVEDGKIKRVEVEQNRAAGGFSGVGIQAAQFAANKGVSAIIAGNFGPNASMVLTQAGIQVVPGFVGMKVKEAIENYLKGSSAAYQASYPPQPVLQPSFRLKPSKTDVEFEKKMLELQKKMIEEEIKYLDKKIKELEKK